MLDEQQKEKLKEIIHLHNQFSSAFKIVENMGDKMDTLSMNDIRYALRGLVDCVNSIVNEDDTHFLEHHTIAMTALKIAWHDIVDVTVKLFRVYLNNISAQYDADIVADFVDYTEARNVLFKVEGLQKEARESRDRRVELYTQISSGDLQHLVTCYHQVVHAEPAILKKHKKEKMKANFIYLGGFTAIMAMLHYVGLLPLIIDSLEGLIQPSKDSS